MSGIQVKTRGGARVSRALLSGADSTDDELRDAVRITANGAVRLYRAQAPKRTGRLARGVEAHIAGTSATVTVHAHNPQTGFDYAPVTRFGRGPIRAQKAKALAFPGPGGIIFRKSVGPWKPSRDWAEGVLPFIAVLARSQLRVAGAKILSV